MTEASGGINRRRVLQGAAWAAPAIIIATAAPARAVSGEPPATAGLIFNGLYAYSQDGFWDASTGTHLTVIVSQANVQNVPDQPPPPEAEGTVTTFDLTWQLPVGTRTTVGKWGLGSNAEGIYDPAVWSLKSGPSIAAGICTVTFTFLQTLGHYANKQPIFWTECLPVQTGQTSRASTLAVHGGGFTSVDARTVTTTFLTAGTPVPDIDDINPNDTYADWVYFPEPEIYPPG